MLAKVLVLNPISSGAEDFCDVQLVDDSLGNLPLLRNVNCSQLHEYLNGADSVETNFELSGNNLVMVDGQPYFPNRKPVKESDELKALNKRRAKLHKILDDCERRGRLDFKRLDELLTRSDSDIGMLAREHDEGSEERAELIEDYLTEWNFHDECRDFREGCYPDSSCLDEEILRVLDFSKGRSDLKFDCVVSGGGTKHIVLKEELYVPLTGVSNARLCCVASMKDSASVMALYGFYDRGFVVFIDGVLRDEFYHWYLGTVQDLLLDCVPNSAVYIDNTATAYDRLDRPDDLFDYVDPDKGDDDDKGVSPVDFDPNNIFGKTLEDWYCEACGMYDQYCSENGDEDADYEKVVSLDDFKADLEDLYAETVNSGGDYDWLHGLLDEMVYNQVN